VCRHGNARELGRSQDRQVALSEKGGRYAWGREKTGGQDVIILKNQGAFLFVLAKGIQTELSQSRALTGGGSGRPTKVADLLAEWRPVGGKASRGRRMKRIKVAIRRKIESKPCSPEVSREAYTAGGLNREPLRLSVPNWGGQRWSGIDKGGSVPSPELKAEITVGTGGTHFKSETICRRGSGRKIHA